jgi:uncharacterized protein (TIGR03086 family)
MSTPTKSVVVLSRALDQAGDVLAAIHEDQLSDPTPCPDWDVARLIGHLLDDAGRFSEQLRGGEPDWAAGPEPAASGWATDFRNAADDLIHLWHQQGDQADAGAADWQTAELAVHTWDLVRATGQARRLDPEVAERGLAFMSAALTPENRGKAFAEEKHAPEGADPYDRIAAFAGRDPMHAGPPG